MNRARIMGQVLALTLSAMAAIVGFGGLLSGLLVLGGYLPERPW